MNQIDINLDDKSLESTIRETVEEVLDLFKLDETFLEIIFVTPAKMQTLNNKYRRIDKPTDVLSFPQPLVPKAKLRLLGSLVIAPVVVAEKNEQIVDVVKHGLLHLLGYDHECDEEAWQQAADKINCDL